MTINQTTLTQAVTYLALAQQLSNLTSSNSSQNSLSNLCSLLSSNNSSDLSPLLNLLGSNSNNNSSSNSIYQKIMDMIFTCTITKLFSKFIENLTSQQTSSTSSESCESGNCSPTDSTTETSTSTSTGTSKLSKLTNDNLESDLRNQKGTSFVIVCGDKCSRCQKFNPVVESINETLGNQATFYSLTGNADTYWTLKKEAGSNTMEYTYPTIIKCVDGKATEVYTYSDISSIYTDTTQMTEWFKNKI